MKTKLFILSLSLFILASSFYDYKPVLSDNKKTDNATIMFIALDSLVALPATGPFL